ncbi:MAG: tRNA (cytidine(34)-2'-O)-methyltransferase [Alphaproteobacteria bacterium]
MRIALYQPDIAPNVGTLLRLGACLSVPVDIIEPCGFPMGDRALRRAGMDYSRNTDLSRHDDWAAFSKAHAGKRRILLTTQAPMAYSVFRFRPDDILLVGRESAGVPLEVHEAVDARIKIPMAEGLRSLNVAVAAAMVLGESLRQTDQFPKDGSTP